MLRAQFTKHQVARREELIIKYVIDYLKDKKENPDLFPYYGLDYCVKWAWPLRFARGNTCHGLRYHSRKAYDFIQQENINEMKKLKRDHIVPHKIFMRLLLSSNDLSIEAVRNKMLRFGELCLVTGKEHNLLLTDCMPDGWTENDDPFGRYRIAGIEVIENNGQWA